MEGEQGDFASFGQVQSTSPQGQLAAAMVAALTPSVVATPSLLDTETFSILTQAEMVEAEAADQFSLAEMPSLFDLLGQLLGLPPGAPATPTPSPNIALDVVGAYDTAHDIATAQVHQSQRESIAAFGAGPVGGYTGQLSVDAQGRVSQNDFGPGASSGTGPGASPDAGVGVGDAGQAP